MNVRTIIITAVAGAALAVSANGREAEAGERIAVLVSFDKAPFAEALKGFQDHLRKRGIQADFALYRLEGSAAKARQAVQTVKASGVALVFAQGSLATNAAVEAIHDIPIVACLIVRTDHLKKTPNATGVGLSFPIDVQFLWMQRFLPNAKTVGVIYNPAENQKIIEAAARIARKRGFTLASQAVRKPQDVPAALDHLAKRADVLWGVPDNLALAPQIARHMLLFSYRNRIPFIGLSPKWVKAGALYAMEWDYADIGAQSGAMAFKILRGVSPRAIPPAPPRKALYSLNIRTAKQMKIDIPAEVIRGAQTVY